MPISQSDLDYMKKVAEYFRSTKTPDEPNGSIRDTAIEFDINRNKVRKILVTMGELTSPITEEAIELRKEGMSIKDIAKHFGVSVATVSTALPYDEKFDCSKEPTKHAAEVRGYRAYEREQMSRQSKLKETHHQMNRKNNNVVEFKSPVDNKEWQKDIKMSYTEAYHRPHRKTWDELGEEDVEFVDNLSEEEKIEYKRFEAEVERIKQKRIEEEQELEDLKSKNELTKTEKKRLNELMNEFGLSLGALNYRNRKILEEIAGDRLPPEPYGVIRLHMELFMEYPDEDITKTLKELGSVMYGDTISRDIIVPADIPLYALHYAIQRAFGWENSHLRQFELPEKRFIELCGDNAALWSVLTGVVFRSPLMEEYDEFWADDYNGGSFKNWLRKKYTGPYMSQCHGEGILSCQEDMMRLDMDEEYYVLYENAYNIDTEKNDGEEFITEVTPVYDYDGRRLSEPKPWGKNDSYRVETVKFEELPVRGIVYLFERNPMALLERLPICAVLAAGFNELPNDCSKKERKLIDKRIIKTGAKLFKEVSDYVTRIIDEQIDSPSVQPIAGPITDELIYNYDFGDNWKIRITASENCPDLIESGRITQAELDRANVKCREVYRPVLIARDGEMLVDDVGGLSGFADFLRVINPDFTDMTPEEKDDAKQQKKDMLVWAKSLGWHREKVSDFNLL